MTKEKILIAVKTYPTISETYDELVCTAGLREDGSWIRLFPIQFRQIGDQKQKYKKWEWIEIDVIKNPSDHRIESYRPMDPDSIKVLERIGTEQNWLLRKQIVLNKGRVYTDLSELIKLNKDGKLSLATFKPTKILDFIVESTDREWNPEKIKLIKEKAKQTDLFGDNNTSFNIARKLPYKFSYKIVDVKGKTSTMMIEDWEIGALYWNCLEKHKDENIAVAKVKEKYLSDIAKSKDVHLFLGTTMLWDKRAPNPFIIIGVFSPPIDKQEKLF